MKTKSLFISCFLVLLPLLLLFLWAFSTKWFYPELWPTRFGLQHFSQMIKEPNFWPAVINSTFIAFAATTLTLLIALPAARFFAFQKVISTRWLEFLIYLPLILPMIAIVTSSQILFIRLGLTGTFTGIILIHTYFMLPYGMQILLESYQKMGEGYQQTAKSLGAGPVRTFFTVTWPQLKPGIMTASGFCYIVSFSQYLPTFFIGGGKIMTLPLILLPYANNGRLGLASAYSFVFLGGSLIGVLLIKYLLKGGGFRGLTRQKSDTEIW